MLIPSKKGRQKIWGKYIINWWALKYWLWGGYTLFVTFIL